MTEEEIIEGNLLIAEFIGNYKNIFEYTPKEELKKCRFDYHKSWDWLMPIIEKIELLTGNFRIVNNIAIIDENDEDGVVKDFISDKIVGTSKIEACYKMCVEFIKWYNNKQKEIK